MKFARIQADTGQSGQDTPTIRQQSVDLFLALLTILFFNLSFPGGNQAWLAWCVMLPLGVSVHAKSPGYAFRLSVCCALLCWLLAVWWVAPGVARVANSSLLLVVPFMLLFCLCYALPYGLAAMLYSRFGWTQTISGAFKGAALWTTICCLVPHILPGNIAHSQYLNPRIIQIVELAGVPLLFFLLHLVNFLGVTTLVSWQSRRLYAFKAAGLALLIPLLISCYGEWRLTELKRFLQEAERPSLQVGLVQPNVSVRSRQRDDWQRESGRLAALTERLIDSQPELDLIVWPEIPPPLSYVQQAEDRKLLDRLIGLQNIPMLIAGHQSQSLTNGAPEQNYFNVAEFITKAGDATVYRKQKLLPFGEYLPFEEELPWLRKLFPNALSYQPGEANLPFRLSDGIELLPLICYEAVFPELVRNGIRNGGNVIINPVDDAWFGKSHAPEIHLALALFRAVEFRLPIVRSSNSGRSVLIDFTGEIVPGSQTELFQSATSAGQVTIAGISTAYQAIGNGFLWLLGTLTAIFLAQEYLNRSC